jgi:glutathione S-transferase
VLVLADRVLEQSLDIMLWALQQSDPLGWLPANDQAMQDALQCVADNDGSFKHHLDRYKYPHRYGLADGLAHRDQGAEFLWQLDARLRRAPGVASAPAPPPPQKGSPEASVAIQIDPCATASFTLSPSQWGLLDAALAPFVRQFAHTDREWFDAQEWSALSQWLNSFEASAALVVIMEKVPPWKPGDAPLYC